MTAHELRTPIGVLAGSAEMLSAHWKDLEDDERADLLASMTSSTGRLRRLLGWDLASVLDDALLVASELATNAVTHAESGCRIRISLTDATLRIDVIDTGAGTPEPQPESFTSEHGRGLRLIDAVTTAWGLEVIPGQGKLVWAELPRPR